MILPKNKNRHVHLCRNIYKIQEHLVTLIMVVKLCVCPFASETIYREFFRLVLDTVQEIILMYFQITFLKEIYVTMLTLSAFNLKKAI